jgi:hypothetical protein
MKFRKCLWAIPLFFLLTFSCRKDHSSETKQPVKADSLPANYSYSSGFCSGVNLGVLIPDTSIYQPDTTGILPNSLLLEMPIPGDQGNQNSCTSWATIYAIGTYYHHLKSGKPYSDTGNLSPKFAYNLITKGTCTCTSFLDNLYILKTQGSATLASMPFTPNECSKQPDSLQKINAQFNAIKNWERVNLNELAYIKRAIQEKMPVLFAIPIDSGFNKLSAPFIWATRSGPIGQLHAMVIVGYDDTKNAFRIMNSWSTSWGDKGFAWVDYRFFENNVGPLGYIAI